MSNAIPFHGKNQQAYQGLKRLILTLELPPGELLNEAELMESLGCGRTPIREAIQRLATENLVVARLRQTAFVASILAHGLAEIVETRLILEIPAARLAAERGSPKERSALSAACEAFRADARANSSDGILSGDAAIHGLIAAMGRNSFLSEYTDRLALFSQRVWWLSVRNAGRDEALVSCHDELTRTICAGDPEAAVRAAADHVALFQARLGHLIQPVPTTIAGRATGTSDRSKSSSAA